MKYVEGFVLAVPAANKEVYRRHAAEAVPLFREFGVTRMVETWGDDVPDGKVTDFRKAVQAKDDEVVLFSWFEYPDRATRDAANERMRTDPRMANMGDMPFDGKRMIFGGFASLIEAGAADGTGYVDGFLVPVPNAKRDAYREAAERIAGLLREFGATRVVESWGDDIPDGKLTDFRRAVQAQGDETVVFSWTEWPSKEARKSGWERLMADPRGQPDQDAMPFDGKRLIYGGFVPIVDTLEA
jgi:uncharacterized protein YbaA (DUF1428 family)